MKLTGFQGFPAGAMHTVLMPQLFYTDLLPKIDDLSELKLTLYIFFLLQTENHPGPWITDDRLRQDPTLLRMMAGTSSLYEPLALLDAALERALIRNTLLLVELQVETSDQNQKAYALNTEKGRLAQRQLQMGVQVAAALPAAVDDQSLPFRHYQQNFGLLTPLVADHIRDLETEFPVDWICEAMEIAVRNNAKSLRYVEVILERWAREGRDDEWH